MAKKKSRLEELLEKTTEVKKGGRGYKATEPTINIGKGGRIGFNSLSWIEYKLKQYKSAELLYDEEDEFLVVKFSKKDDKKFKVKKNKDSDAGFISGGKSLLNTFKLGKEYNNFPIESEIDVSELDSGYLILELKIEHPEEVEESESEEESSEEESSEEETEEVEESSEETEEE